VIPFDTSVVVYASDRTSPFHAWAREIIAEALASDGAAINAVSLAELCVGDTNPGAAAERLRLWGVSILDVPASAAEVCADAYRLYRFRRLQESGQLAPRVPLPDFFIGAHAAIMGWEIATADEKRFRQCFPSVPLRTPI
jgi:predicted nucleic acid-binding protein